MEPKEGVKEEKNKKAIAIGSKWSGEGWRNTRRYISPSS